MLSVGSHCVLMSQGMQSFQLSVKKSNESWLICQLTENSVGYETLVSVSFMSVPSLISSMCWINIIGIQRGIVNMLMLLVIIYMKD